MAAAEAGGTAASGDESSMRNGPDAEQEIVKIGDNNDKNEVSVEKHDDNQESTGIKRPWSSKDDNDDEQYSSMKLPRVDESPMVSPSGSTVTEVIPLNITPRTSPTPNSMLDEPVHCLSDTNSLTGSGSCSDDDYRLTSGGITLPTRTYSCKICGQSTTSSRQHLHHQKEQHNMDYVIYECDMCDYATQYKQKLPRHKKCHYTEDEGDAPIVIAPQTTLGYTTNNFHTNSMVSILRKPDALHDRSSLVDHGPHIQSDINHMQSLYEAGAMSNNRIMFGQHGMWDPKLLQKTEGARKVVKKSPVVREAVDPAKYLAIQEEDGLKFACSKCGNKYKWRKSLNKHWKEKHEGETPPGANSRFTMLNVPSIKNNQMQSEKILQSINAATPQRTSPPSFYKPQEPNSPDQVLNTLKQMTPSLPYPYDLARSQMAAYHSNLSHYLSLLSASPPKAHGAAMYYPHIAAMQQNSMNAYNAALYASQPPVRVQQPDDILDLSMKEKASPTVSDDRSKTPTAAQDQPLDFSTKLSPAITSQTSVSNVKPTTDNDKVDITSTCFLCSHDFNCYDALNKHFIDKHMPTINEQIQNDLLDDIGIERQVDARKFEYLCQYLVRGQMSEDITCIVCGMSGNKHVIGAHLYSCHAVLSEGVDISTPRARTPEEVSSDDDAMTCNQCGFRARSHVEVERHILVHLLNRSHACSKCGYSTQHEEDLRIHIERYHDNASPIKVEDGTPKTTPTKVKPSTEASSASSSTSEPVLPYKCVSCEYRARWPSEITQHMKNHSDEKPFHCPRCRYRSKWKWDVVKHLKRCGGGTIKDVIDTSKGKGHVEPADVPIVIKPESTYTESNVLETIQREQSKSPVNKATLIGSKFYCMQCPFIGNSPAELKRHSRVHSDEKPFLCKTCGYRSKWKCDLKKHVRNYNHEPAVDFEASPCRDSIPKEVVKNLNSILEQTTPEDQSNLYQCHQCAYATHKKSTLDTHMKIHLPAGLMRVNHGNEKYKCKQCGVTSADLPSFLQHKVSHTSDVNQPSTLEAFHTPVMAQHESLYQPSSGLYDHVLPLSMPKPTPMVSISSTLKDDEVVVVQGVTLRVTRRRNKKVYNCPKCPFTHNNVGNATRHARQHGSMHKHTCTKCDYSVDQKRYLINHMRTVHGQDENASITTSKGVSVIVRNSYTHANQPNLQIDAMTKQNKSQRKIHLKRYHVKTVKSGKKSACFYMCKLCHYSSSMKHLILLHQSTHLKSKLLVTSNRDMDTKPTKLSCSLCPFTCMKELNLDKHRKSHGPNRKHSCNMCNFSVNRIELLLRHISLHTQFLAAEVRKQAMSSRISPNCGNVSELMKYDVNRELSPPQKIIRSCQKCPYKTKVKKQLVKHERKHVIRSKLKCMYCNYSSGIANELDMHMKLHEPCADVDHRPIKLLVKQGRISQDPDIQQTQLIEKKTLSNSLTEIRECAF